MSKVQLVIFLKAFFFWMPKIANYFYFFFLYVLFDGRQKSLCNFGRKISTNPPEGENIYFFIFLLSCVVLCILCILDLHQLSMYLLCTSIYFNTTNILILICFNKNWQTFKKFFIFRKWSDFDVCGISFLWGGKFTHTLITNRLGCKHFSAPL